MSLINTNYDYLRTMGIAEDDPLVGVIVSVYYLGCAVGAVIASWFANLRGRKPGIMLCLATAADNQTLGGIDAVVPVYTSELSDDDARGEALAKEFQANIFGLNMAFIVNVLLTNSLGKNSPWAWRLPIIVMQIYPLLLFAVVSRLPETPRWFILHERQDDAKQSLADVFGADTADEKLSTLVDAHEEEQKSGIITYSDLLLPSGNQSHPTTVTIMGQVNQALTGYGAVSVYGPQIFELLGFSVMDAEYITLGNYISYFLLMTLAWLLIDRKGRRWLLVNGAWGLLVSFLLLTLLGGLGYNATNLHISYLGPGISGAVVLYFATAVFGIGWLVPPWLIPTEIYPSTARAQGSAISVIIWGLANFTVTLLTPIGFNKLHYWLFLVFAATNAFAGWWTWLYVPESGGRSFEENQEFFKKATEAKSWSVFEVGGGAWSKLPEKGKGGGEEVAEGERQPLLSEQRS
ncbi:MAG: hypothetical protein Q9160_005378 [Pyrenula sp. 1 TL-2023]